MAKDYYAVLGVNRQATEAEIKQAFRKLAHEHHPDKTGGNADKFKELNEAYQVLSNKDKRAQYDQFGRTFEGGAAGGPGFGGFSWQDMGGRGGNPFGGFSDAAGGAAFDFGDLGDVLGDMFGFRTEARSRGDMRERGRDVEVVVPISFLESFTGAEKQISLRTSAACATCRGSGAEPGAAVTTCTACRGTGVVTSTRTSFLGSFNAQTTCTSCNGRGSKADKVCRECRGQTVTSETTQLKVSIPAGIDESTTLRLTGKGNVGRFGGLAGDVYVRVTVASDLFFKREGSDLKSREEALLSILARGGTIQARTPTGFVAVKIPAGTPSGKSFVLKGRGFEKLHGRGRGDHIIAVHTKVPDRLNSKQRKLLEEFENSLI